MFLRILKLLPPYKFSFMLAVVCMVGFALSNGAMVYLIGPVMKFLFSSESGVEVQIIPYNLIEIPKEQMIIAIPIQLIDIHVLNLFDR